MKPSFFLTFLFAASFAFAAEFKPVSVWTADEVFPNPPGRYAIERMIDGDLGTYACILDDTRDGSDEKGVYPPKAQAPVTGRFILDLGEVREVKGVRFVARNAGVLTMASNVTIFTCDDAQGTQNCRAIVRNVELPLVNWSNSAFVQLDEPVKTRFLGVRVNESNQRKISFNWDWTMRDWERHLGLPSCADGRNLNIQIAEISCFDAPPADVPVKNPPEVAFPEWRLQRDWLTQDCGLDIQRAFRDANGNEFEKQLVSKVLKDCTFLPASKTIAAEVETLAKDGVPGTDARWKTLYFLACAERRKARLADLLTRANQFIYVKHHVFGSTNGLIGKYDIPDEQVLDVTPSYKPGSQLCLATLHEDGTVTNEVLIEKPEGCICYPTLSYDGKTLVFSMRSDFRDDSLYLYSMDLGTRQVKQLTFPLKNAEGKVLHVADCEPFFLPNGRIVFSSTRSIHISDCWYRASADIYSCAADGSDIRRMTYDQLQTNLPQILEDGKVVFTRWEYNDRSALYNHPLISMNPDGTQQTEYYGNDSMFPSSILHAQRIPGSSKVLATISGHHTIYKGKLGIVDRTQGTQGDEGITLVNTKLDGTLGSEHADVKPRGIEDFMIDIFGQIGPQYAHPFAFDEENFLCSFVPEGSPRTFGPLNPPFGAYYMKPDGTRELLAFDPWQGTGRIVPVMKQTVPPDRGDHVDLDDNFGTFYLQNVYFGPGLKGIEPGKAKKLRVVALEYRCCRMGYGQNGGECETGLCQTPISLNSGSWDVKHVIGEVEIEEDGSCCFQVPARLPVYFQVLDENGFTLQSMRSWATLMNGEQFACLGCHENKNDALTTSQRGSTLAMRKPIQIPRRLDGSLHPLVAEYQNASWLDSTDLYLGIQRPRSLDPNAPVDGFSYRQEIQPILDRHCVKCHDGKNEKTTLCLTGEIAKPETISLIGAGNVDPKRAYTRSYVELTTSGKPDGNPWMTWLKPRSRAEMLPPKMYGAVNSPKIFTYFEPSHYGVQMSDAEKRTFACWLDLLIPFCGSYCEANTWTDEEKKEYEYFQEKRRIYAEEERKTLKK
ncbi:MAG: hypothetical protein Q4A17_07430 [Thermoguttaceae bacterium]|nr:hypothetical protein [Thermoguttaceae bacterium]